MFGRFLFSHICLLGPLASKLSAYRTFAGILHQQNEFGDGKRCERKLFMFYATKIHK